MFRSASVLLVSVFLLMACVGNKQRRNVSIKEDSRGVVIFSEESILFDSGAADIKKDAVPFLGKVAEIIISNKNIQVVVEGHTDNVGSDLLNQELSELRALKVMVELVDRGVNKERVQYVGYGMLRPVASNETEYGRSQNRRTEIVLVGAKKEEIVHNESSFSLPEYIESIF